MFQFKKSAITVLVCAALVPILVSWGTFGHEYLNRSAVFALPDSMRTFFFNHIDFITQESTVADVRKYAVNDRQENPRHFIDLEHYPPVDSLKVPLKTIQSRYKEDFIQKSGILPWYIPELTTKLTEAFRKESKTEILFLAANLAHYLGDATQPLHTTSNYDGQLTGQKGIHAFYESQLLEFAGNRVKFNNAEVRYIPDVTAETWKIIINTHNQIPQLLKADSLVTAQFNGKGIFVTNEKGETLRNRYRAPVRTKQYMEAYYAQIDGMLGKQMKTAADAIASYWYTAWVDAGRPDLTQLDPEELTRRNKKFLKQELKLWQKGKLFGVKPEKEF